MCIYNRGEQTQTKKGGILILVVSAWVFGLLIVGCEPQHPSADSSTNSAVTIDPLAVSLSASKSIMTVFTASGGDGIYSWTLSNNSLGLIAPNSSVTADVTTNLLGSVTTNSVTVATNVETATYQNYPIAGANILTVRDSSGLSATATITQQ